MKKKRVLRWRKSARGIRVYLIGGELKSSTEAVVGSQAMHMLQNYHFTKGFFGANGVSVEAGLTTPDANEALIKQTAWKQCRKSYVLCDATKFDHVSSVTVADFPAGVILTERCPKRYQKCENIVVCR